MQNICSELGKELIVIDGDMSYCAEFLVKLATAPRDIESRMIVQKIIADNAGLLSSIDTVILLDCDRTLTNNDTTMSFCGNMSVLRRSIKDVYRGEYYSVYQFYKANRIYDESFSNVQCSTAQHAVLPQMKRKLIMI